MSEVDDTLISALQQVATAGGKKSSFGTRGHSGVAAEEFRSGLDTLDLDSGPEPGPSTSAAAASAPKTAPRPTPTAQPAAAAEPTGSGPALATMKPLQSSGLTSWFTRVWQKLRGWFAED